MSRGILNQAKAWLSICQACKKDIKALSSSIINCYYENLPEVNHMSKARDTKKSDKKKPQKTAKEKKQEKREKKNK
jgi:hypothetical protein